jgi:phage portal protein BeeE
MGRLTDAWRAFIGRSAGQQIDKSIQLQDGIPLNDLRSAFMVAANASGTAARRGTREVYQSVGTNPWVASAFRKIATSVAGVPWKLYAQKSRRTGKYVQTSALQRLGPAERAKALEEIRAAGELVEIDTHPLLQLLDRPNPHMTGVEAMEFTQLSDDLVGDTLWVLARNPMGMPVAYWPFPKHWVALEQHGAELRFRVNAFQGSWLFPKENVVWFRTLNPSDPYGRGAGYGDALSDELDTDEGAAKRTKNFFAQGAMAEFAINVAGADAKTLTAMKEDFNAKHQGFWNAFRNLWTGAAKVDVTRLDTSFREMTLVELRKFERDTIGQVTGLPPELRGILDQSNRATIEAADVIHAKHVMLPRMERRRMALQVQLVPQFDERLVLDFDRSFIPEDRELRAKVMATVPDVFRVDEHRALAGHPPLEDEDLGQALYVRPAAASPFGMPSPAAAADPPWAKGLGRGRAKDITEGDVSNVLEALRPARLSDEMDPVMAQRLEEWGRRALAGVGGTGSFDLQNPLIRRILDNAAARVVGVTQTTRDRLRDTLLEGVRGGEGIDALARRVREEFDGADQVRALTIARTEVLGAANGGNHAAWKMSGVVTAKRWVHNRSADPRPSHQALDGTELPLDGLFQADGESAPHPGAFPSPENTINCRCGMRPVVPDPKAAKDLSDEERAEFFKRFDDASAPWLEAAVSALRRGFRAQERDVLAELKKRAG